MPRSRFVEANGLRFHVLEEGEGDRLALCLHGFPELSYSWRHQLAPLASLGYRVWAPDLRGYGKTDRPTRVEDYAIETLVDDLVGLVGEADRLHGTGPAATVIAHDWGGFVAWHAAMRRPDVLERLCVMNIPHPACLAREVGRFGRQLRRLSYVAIFQIPGLPERLLSMDGHRRIENAFTTMAVDPTRFSREDLRVYREAAAEPGAIAAMLAYYRAYLRGGGGARQRRLGWPRIEAPTLIVWGEHDTALGRETVVGTSDHVSDLTVRYVPTASHWVQQEAPEVVNALLTAWLRGEPVPQAWEIA